MKMKTSEGAGVMLLALVTLQMTVRVSPGVKALMGVHDQILDNVRITVICQSSGALSDEGASLFVAVGHQVLWLSVLTYTYSSILNAKSYEIETL